jgi:glycine oxidase
LGFFWNLKSIQHLRKVIKQLDYIVVGQGLAGSCVALQLLKRNRKILVIDQPNLNIATKVAAGLFNPITGKAMSKTWKAEELFTYLHSFYLDAETELNSRFFYSLPLYRPFVSIEEQNEWMAATSNALLNSFIQAVCTSPQFVNEVINPLGGLLLKQCGFVDTNHFSKAVQEKLIDEGSILMEDFDENQLELFKSHVVYRGIQAKYIIYCNGVAANTSKFFNWLPIRPLKGETLTIKPDITPTNIYNRGVYLVPQIWTVGATYSNQDKTASITRGAKAEMVSKLNELIPFQYIVINQNWGMRPTTPDRRPILGRHPEFESLVIFNGLGTKGVSLAPYFSNELVMLLENGISVNKEVDINRYKSLYWKSA